MDSTPAARPPRPSTLSRPGCPKLLLSQQPMSCVSQSRPHPAPHRRMDFPCLPSLPQADLQGPQSQPLLTNGHRALE